MMFKKEFSAMSAAPSRLMFGIIPWYSILIVLGVVIAIILAVREEKRAGLKKDTVLDFALIVLPCGILGARFYYVVFSWDQFKNNLLSVFRIWEGGIAIYGAVIAGLLAAWFFSRRRKFSFFTLCDILAPGLILAQAIGRWGNYFNQECFGAAVTDPSLQFFPFAVQIQADAAYPWHMATFFYESVWNLMVFVFLMIARRKLFRYRGDVISFYALLYACGRLIIEDFSTDSLFAASSVRVSQLLSVVICILILFRYLYIFRRSSAFRPSVVLPATCLAFAADVSTALWMANLVSFSVSSLLTRFLLLACCSILNIAVLFIVYGNCAEGEIIYADR